MEYSVYLFAFVNFLGLCPFESFTLMDTINLEYAYFESKIKNIKKYKYKFYNIKGTLQVSELGRRSMSAKELY